MSATLQERFWAKVRKTPTCWEWTASLTGAGYGKIGVNGRIITASRLSFEWACGPIPPGMFICHHCDNPKCVRPDHLFLGTALDNSRDCKAKGRTAAGERCGRSKLTFAQVAEIRRDTGVQRRLSERYGVSPALICLIKSRKVWVEA